ncbi:hypothetical protein [Fructobacillus parabroussonetiae]|uniref:Uncharacterized protein n=1 Tax=Fructobacillus parabroussonetiae TaxID=2713174 RepID=A0ABS5QW74_9LACO|nr:hypothetical protein [Fructobacillus parabroussonetiae]MBS9337458.1 hypothetical protein [Fructobacillus parabroussonetiae]
MIALKHISLKENLRDYLFELEEQGGSEPLAIPRSKSDVPMVYRDNLELIQIILDSPEDSLAYSVAQFQLEENGLLPTKEGEQDFVDLLKRINS